VRKLVLGLVLSGLLFAVACGGSGGGSSTSGTSNSAGENGGTSPAGNNSTSGINIAALIVDAGPPNLNHQGKAYIDSNIAFMTIKICAPGTATCQTIDHVIVDTGSSGLRVPYQVFGQLNPALLPNVNGSALMAECIQFLDNSFFWGSVRYADVYIGGPNNDGEVASSIPIHVMGDPALPAGSSIPASCSNVATSSGQVITGTEEDTVAAVGGNGLLGLGVLQYDCDALVSGYYAAGSNGHNPCTCPSNPQNVSCTDADFSLPPASYYTCSGGTCTSADLAIPLAQQVRNPVSMFATDNNGVILELPAVPIGGQADVLSGGSVIFGIGTQSNNALAGSATMLIVDTNPNNPDWTGFTTVFNGTSYPNATEEKTLRNKNSKTFTIGSFLDSGSNGIFFLDQPTSGVLDCTGGYADFYCPDTGQKPYYTQALSADNIDVYGNSSQVQFNVSNTRDLSSSYTAFSDRAGPNTSGSSVTSVDEAADGYFDWGLTFFYGKSVYTAIQGVVPPSGVQPGPWWAY